MNTYLIYGIILVILLILELLYFTIADKFDIIDKPNERGLCLPSDNKMTVQQQEQIIEIIKSCFM